MLASTFYTLLIRMYEPCSTYRLYIAMLADLNYLLTSAIVPPAVLVTEVPFKDVCALKLRTLNDLMRF